MKKLSLFLITLCLVALAGCGHGKDKKDADYKEAKATKGQVEVSGTVEEAGDDNGETDE